MEAEEVQVSPEIELTDHAVQVYKLATKLGELRAKKKWGELAAAWSAIEGHARSAGFNINDILRPNGTEARP